MDPVAWFAVILFLVIVVGARHLARRSEAHNEYIDETDQRDYKAPPISGTGYFG